MSYSFYPLIKQVPPNGGEFITDVKLAFSDAGGANRTRVKYNIEKKDFESINRERHALVFGFRSQITFEFDIITITDQVYLADVVNQSSVNLCDTFLSIDAGANYERVLLKDVIGPTPIKGKMTVGATYAVTFDGADLLEEIPYIAGPYAAPLGTEPVMTLPPPSRFLRGQGRLLEGTLGAEDTWWVCMGLGGGSDPKVYQWIPVAAAGYL